MIEIIGIDIGGTNIKGAALDENRNILKREQTPTQGKTNRETILNNLFFVIDKLISDSTQFIAIASAGNINNITGEVFYATDNLMGWTGTPIKKLVEERYKINCMCDNDAVAALIGELSLLDNPQNVTMITLGTGVGGASLVNGKILRGKSFDAGRWGHTILQAGGKKCNCGAYGCAEQYLSGRALINSAKENGLNIADGSDIFTLYCKEDKIAKKIVDIFFGYLNALLQNIYNSISPDLIIIGGGVAGSLASFKRLIDRKYNTVIAKLGNDAGIIGTANFGIY